MNVNVYVPAAVILVIATLWFLAQYLAKKRAVDLEVLTLKRSRKIWVPDDAFHLPVINLQLCVSCEAVHTTEICPRCGSEVVIPLRRIIQSTRALEFPIKRTHTMDNVIPLPIGKSV